MSDWAKLKVKAGDFQQVVLQNLSKFGLTLKREGVITRKSLDLLITKRRLRRTYAQLGMLVYETHFCESEDMTALMNSEIASTQKVTIPVADMRDGDAKMFELNGIAGVLIKKEGGAFAAFYAICTHLGCVVQWQKEKGQFLCPCHAGLFSSDGAVLAGPPPKPLSKIPFTHANGVVSIG